MEATFNEAKVPRWVVPGESGPRIPTPRSFHTCSLIGDGSLVIFGGVTGDSDQPRFLNDVWIKPKLQDDWRDDLLVFSGSRNQPAPRCRHVAIPLRNGLFIFGGASTTIDAVDNSVFRLERKEDGLKYRWIRVTSMGNQPCARFGHCAERLNDTSFIIFGGQGLKDGISLKDSYIFDSLRNVWSRVEMHGLVKPSPGTDYFLFPFKESSKGTTLLLIGTRLGEDEDEYGGHSVAENVVAYVLNNQNQKRQWACIPLRFAGQRGNGTRQTSSSSFTQRLCLAETAILQDPEGSGSSLLSKGPELVGEVDEKSLTDQHREASSASHRQLRSFSTAERRRRSRNAVYLFPAERWLPTFIRTHDGFVYLLGGIRKKTGERPSPTFVWRFSLDGITVSTSSYWATWECIRTRHAGIDVFERAPRVGWSVTQVPASAFQRCVSKSSSHMNEKEDHCVSYKDEDLSTESDEHFLWDDVDTPVLFIFGGTEVSNSFLEDPAESEEKSAETSVKSNTGGTTVHAAASFTSAMLAMMDTTGDDGFDVQRKQLRVVRKMVDSPLMMRFDSAKHRGEKITCDSMKRFDEHSERMLHTRVGFVTDSIAVRFIKDSVYVQCLPVINAGGSRQPSLATSMHSFKVFDGNTIWAVSWDLSLFIFSPRPPTGPISPPNNDEQNPESNSLDRNVDLMTVEGSWHRISKPVVLPSPSTGTQFEFIDSELSVLWPDSSRDGFAVERFSPNDLYLKHRRFSEFEKAFDGDVLVLMGGMKRSVSKERKKAAKLLGFDETGHPSAASRSTESFTYGSSDKRNSSSVQVPDDLYLNDIWIAYSSFSSRKNYFSPPSASLCSWKKLWPPSEITALNADDAVFQGRSRHTLTALPSLGLLVAFGGVADGEKAPHSSLILVDLTMRTRDFTYASLSVPVQSGKEPLARCDHAAAATFDEETPRLVVCGGRAVATNELLRDVHVWEVCTGLWSEVLLDVPLRSLGWLHYGEGRFYFFPMCEEQEIETDQTIVSFGLI